MLPIRHAKLVICDRVGMIPPGIQAERTVAESAAAGICIAGALAQR